MGANTRKFSQMDLNATRWRRGRHHYRLICVNARSGDLQVATVVGGGA